MSRITVVTLAAISQIAFVGGCSEPDCPYGYYKMGQGCFRYDAGSGDESESTTGDEAGAAQPAADRATDLPAEDASSSLRDAGPHADPGTGVDAADATVNPVLDAATADAGLDASVPSSSDSAQSDGALADVCAPSPCQHGGTCSRTAQGAVCDCNGTGFEGTRCDVDIDECALPNLCKDPDYPCVQTEPPGYTCEGQMADWPMPDAVLSANVRPDYDTASVPGVVIDKVTGLAWQRALPTTYDRCTGNISAAGDTCTWEEAKAYCGRLELGSSDDWRLPSKIELESIADDTQRQSPSIDPSAFPQTPAGYYWSRSSYTADAGQAWISGGHTASLPMQKATTARVRCVRTKHPPRSGTPDRRYTITGASSLYPDVADARTGLVWKLKTEAAPADFDAARTQCASFGGAWRLPTKKELQTLVDLGQASQSAKINPVFSGTQRALYRSSSLFWDGALLMSVDFDTGATVARQNSDPMLARCVR